MDRRQFFKNALIMTGGLAVCGIAGENLLGITNSNPSSKNKNENKMKIVVLTGSPRKNGNSAHLANQFIKGAEEAGHEVFRFDCALQKVNYCTGCLACGYNGPCVIRDDFDLLSPHLVAADMIVFATPVYYYGISGQLKTVIDRFNAFNNHIKDKNKKSAFMTVCANASAVTTEPILHHYKALCGYLGFEDMGTVVAPGVYQEGDVEKTDYGQQAYLLGKNL